MRYQEDPFRHSDYFLFNGVELTEHQRIAEENDLFRKLLCRGSIRLSDMVATLPVNELENLIQEVQAYEFAPSSEHLDIDNRERKMGTVQHGDEVYAWIIYGYYNENGTPNEHQLERYLLIKHSSERADLQII